MVPESECSTPTLIVSAAIADALTPAIKLTDSAIVLIFLYSFIIYSPKKIKQLNIIVKLLLLNQKSPQPP